MDKFEKRAFKLWLNTASDREIQMKLLRLETLKIQFTEENVLAEYCYLRNEILREVDARRQIDKLTKK